MASGGRASGSRAGTGTSSRTDKPSGPPRPRPGKRFRWPATDWALATWLTPAVSMLVFGLMIVAALANADAGAATLVTAAVAGLVAVGAGVALVLRGRGPRGRGVGVALVVGGLLSGLLGVWLVVT